MILLFSFFFVDSFLVFVFIFQSTRRFILEILHFLWKLNCDTIIQIKNFLRLIILVLWTLCVIILCFVFRTMSSWNGPFDPRQDFFLVVCLPVWSFFGHGIVVNNAYWHGTSRFSIFLCCLLTFFSVYFPPFSRLIFLFSGVATMLCSPHYPLLYYLLSHVIRLNLLLLLPFSISAIAILCLSYPSMFLFWRNWNKIYWYWPPWI